MEDKKKDYIIGILIVIIFFIIGFLGYSFFQSESSKVENKVPAVNIQLVEGHPKTLLEGYITDVSPITKEMRVMVILSQTFVNPPEVGKEIVVKIVPNTDFRILLLPEKIDGTDWDSPSNYVELDAEFEDFEIFDNITVSTVGDIRDIFKDEPIVAKLITRME